MSEDHIQYAGQPRKEPEPDLEYDPATDEWREIPVLRSPVKINPSAFRPVTERTGDGHA